MLNIRRFILFTFLLCIGKEIIVAEQNTPLQHTQENCLNDTIIDSVINTQLQKNLLALTKGNLDPDMSKQEATYLLLAAMDETHALQILSFLVKSFKKNKQGFDRHKVMLQGLGAPISIVKYLLEKGIYNKGYLSKKQHDNFLLKLDKLHIAYILLIDSFNITLIPPFITYIWGLISSFKTIIWLLSWFSTKCDDLTKWINGYTGKLDFLFSLKGFLFFYLVCILYSLYISIKVSIKPGYIFHLFAGDFEHKPKKEIEEKALLLLQYGANPNAKALFVKKQEKLMTLMQLPEGLSLYSYDTISITHLASEHNMYRLVQALLKKGAKPNAITLSMKDTLNYPPKPGQMPFQFITTQNLYNRDKGVKQTPLDLAPPGSSTAQYLKEHGAKYYQEIKPAKKT